MSTIPAELSNYAAQASYLTKLDKNVILSQWIAENGWTVPKGYNFGNIMSNGKPVVYASATDGLTAYASLINSGSYYDKVRASVTDTPTAQLKAIASSPWDAGHYGGDGSTLTNVYNSVTGASIAPVIGINGVNGSSLLNLTSIASDKLISAFWLVVGVVLVFFGVQMITNPMEGLTDAIRSLGVNKNVE